MILKYEWGRPLLLSARFAGRGGAERLATSRGAVGRLGGVIPSSIFRCCNLRLDLGSIPLACPQPAARGPRPTESNATLL